MGWLPGCNCRCGSSENSSTPSSEGSSSSVPDVPESVVRDCHPDDNRCLDNRGPAVFKITVDDLSGSGPCYSGYVGEFLVYVTSNPTVCFSYESVERPKIHPGTNPCAELTDGPRRWTVGIGKSGPNTIVTVGCLIQFDGVVSLLGGWIFTAGGSGINCVGSFTCTKFTIDDFRYPFPETVSVSAV